MGGGGRALRRAVSDLSEEMQSKNLHSGGVGGGYREEVGGEEENEPPNGCLHVASPCGDDETYGDLVRFS